MAIQANHGSASPGSGGTHGPAAFPATLSPRERDAPILCAGWRVRDVVAHVVSYDELDGRALARRFAGGGLRPSRINAIGVASRRSGCCPLCAAPCSRLRSAACGPLGEFGWWRPTWTGRAAGDRRPEARPRHC
ncbi:maleylpyruvate isomerase N-terminal domain-containing protein [Saccharopolyspora erythraea]|uniref:Mycothiol-dependent maleylpyruvate isomerase metal-binding domain-containing protein n=2 Tax=Saccharopolyspora erythraea TaxID=1836 RepID=A0ABN1D8V9_SACER